MMRSIVSAFALTLVASVASADFAKVDNLAEFKSIVAGKTLTRPMIRLEVTPGGDIRGMGARWEVTGNWSWQDGYFCRDLYWGGDALGYNCQEVRVKENRIRFTSDRGRGDSAVFRLRAD
ncbi:MAG: dihydrodipicolinate reductase [Arenibacterium sp.]